MADLNGTGRLADDLYLLAHDDVTGRPRLHPRAAGLGLAGALLAELALPGSIRVEPDRIIVAGRSPPGDGLARAVLEVIASEPVQLAARDWLLFLARTAAVDVAVRLERAGYLTRIASRRPWHGERWVPVDSSCAFAPVLRVKSSLDPAQPVPDQNAVLTGLAAACGLSSHLALYLPSDARGRFDQAVSRLHPGLRNLIAQTRAAVDSALLTHRM